MNATETEAIRAARQAIRDRRDARKLATAARLEAEAAQKMAEFNRYRGDIAYTTQPARGSAFGKRRTKAVDRYTTGLGLLSEAETLRQSTGGRVAVAGDAAKRRAARIAEQETRCAVGMRITSPIYGPGVVKKVNRISYTIAFDRGFTFACDKSLIEPA